MVKIIIYITEVDAAFSIDCNILGNQATQATDLEQAAGRLLAARINSLVDGLHCSAPAVQPEEHPAPAAAAAP